MKFEDIITHIGEFGRYQKLLFTLVCLTIIPTAFLGLLPVFNLARPEHRCAVPGLDNDTYTIQGAEHERLINMTIPWETEDGKTFYSKCSRYQFGGGQYTNQTEKCQSWVYDKSVFKATVVTKFNIVCDDKILRSHSNMVWFAGSMTGTIGLGFLSDLIGRKKVLFLSLVLLCGTFIGTAFVPSMDVFQVLRYFSGLSSPGVFMTSFVVVIELVGPSQRVIAGNVVQLFWCLGLFILGAEAYLLRDWFHLQLALSTPCVLLLAMWWVIPESPRWLLSKGRNEEAEVVFRKAARINKVDLPPKIFEKETLEETGSEGHVWEMFTNPRLFVRAVIIFFNWMVVSMVYYGLGLNVQNLSGDIYLNFTIANISETVAYALCIILLNRTGRKFLHCGSILLGGIACLATIFPVVYGDDSHMWIVTVLSMVGKLGGSAAFAVIFIFSAELFPTVVRNSAMGASNMFARIGAMISPYIADLGILIGGDLKAALPLIVFGAAAIAAGLTALYLPETLSKTLPETIDDAKRFGSESEDKYQPRQVKENGRKSLYGVCTKETDEVTRF